MTDRTFHHYMNAFYTNYDYNPVFREYVNSIPNSTHVGFYGNIEPNNAKELIGNFRKNHIIFFNDPCDFDTYLDMIPNGTFVNIGEYVPIGFLEWQREKCQRCGQSFYKRGGACK